jgi:hypothetical protein
MGMSSLSLSPTHKKNSFNLLLTYHTSLLDYIKILFSWLQVGGVESIEVPEFAGIVEFCGGSSVLEENSNVWSV